MLPHPAELDPGLIRANKSFEFCVDVMADGKLQVMERYIGISRTALRAWKQGTSLPQLGHLLRICLILGISALDFLTGNLTSIDRSQQLDPQNKVPYSCQKSSRRIIDKEAMQRKLEGILETTEDPPPSMRQVGARLGHLASNLAKLFPEQCHDISAKFMRAQHQRRLLSIQHACHEVWEIMLQLHAAGIYPGQDQILYRLTKPGVMWEPEVKAAWRIMLKELGLEDMNKSSLTIAYF